MQEDVTTAPGLEMRNIRKSFGAVVALKGADLSVKSGEICSLLGGNGSGKSTLAKILGGAVSKDDGAISVDGNEIGICSPISAIGHGIAVTAQELSLFPNRTVLQNLSLLNTPKKFLFYEDRAVARSRALKALERVGLESLLDSPVSKLSDNQKYLVEFSKALLFEPKILIVDEITSALRREEVALVGKILKDLAAQGRTILFISHRLNEIFDICSTVTILRNGEAVNTYDLGEVDENTLLSDMIGIEAKKRLASGMVNEENDAADRGETLLSAKGITVFGYAGGPVDIELKKGEILGVSGLQGQGQSELLKTLYSIYGPIDVEINGKKKKIENPRSAIAAGMGYLTGDRIKDGVFVGRSIGENLVAVNNVVLNRPRLDCDKVLQESNVKYKSASDPIETLSGGNQQKVVIARWTSVDRKVILADDPTKGIDVAARRDVHEVFRRIASGGAAVIFVSSDDEELVTMAKTTENYSVVVMYNGAFVKRLYGKDINTNNIISASIPGGKAKVETDG